MSSYENNSHYFLQNGGEMGKLIREKDWSKTSLGNPENWPTSLRTIVSIMLNNPFGMMVVWSNDYIQIYNDGYRPILGLTKHPQALGLNSSTTFEEIWHIIGPMFDNVMKGETVHQSDFFLQLNRNGFLEDCYFDFAYSPITQEDGNIGGILVTVVETTERKLKTNSLKLSNTRYFKNIMQAPVAMSFLRGKELIVDIANEFILEIWGKTKEQVMSKPLFEGLPEAKNQGLEELLEQVLATGKQYIAYEKPILLPRNGDIETVYVNFVYEAFREDDDTINGIVVIANDVTLQVKAKHFIAESEKQFRTMVMNSPIPMTIIRGENYKIEMANKTMFDTIWRKKENEVVGKGIMEVFPELKQQKYADLLNKVFTTGIAHREIESIAYIEGNDGLKKFYLDYEYAPLFEKNGEISGIMITVNDVSSKVEARIKTEDSEKKFRLLADSMPQHIWTSDPEGNLNYYNQSVFKFSGLSNDAINTLGWLHIVHPDDREKNIEEWTKAITNGEDFLFEHRFRRHDGEYRWQLSRAIPQRDKEGNIVMWVGTSTDIQDQKNFVTELEKQVKQRTKDLQLLNHNLKNSEERYHLMVEEVQDYAILYLNPFGIVENWNKGAEKIKGYKSEEIIGKSFSVFYTLHDRNNNLPEELLKRAFTTGRAVQEGWRVRKDKTHFWASVVITAVHNDSGKVIGFSKVTHDLTEKKKADDTLRKNAQELQEKNDALEKMNKELQSFAYISSHDLQEPLRKIQTFSTQIIEKEFENLSDNGKDKFYRMQSAAKRMQTLIEDLLAYSRTNTSEKKLELIDLKTIVEDVKDDLSEEIANKNAIIEIIEICKVKIITFQFRQLLYNLISNSIKFSNETEQPRIRIFCKIAKGKEFNHNQLDPDLEYCNIKICDNGIGFDQQYGERIFEVFQRLHGREKYLGTGIGLAIVKKIVENHDGFITATGEVNKGASFDIYFPSL
jgi:PAS domain S-box-containing protein